MIKDMLTLRLSAFKSSPRTGTAFAICLVAMLCWRVYAMVNENIEKNQTRELGREIAAREQQAQEEERANRRATLRAAFEALRNTPPAPPTYYCAELCPGLGRILGDPVTAIWEHNGLNTDPSALYLWTPTNYVATLLAPTHATNAPFAWPNNATVLLEDYGVFIAVEDELGFSFPLADETYDATAMSTSGVLFFGNVAYPRGEWPVTTPRRGDNYAVVAVRYGNWQLLPGSRMETIATNKTLRGATIPGKAYRWKDMASFDNPSTNRVTFGAVLWKNGDVEKFIEGDVAELPGITGVQHGSAHWVVPSVASGDRLTYSRLLEPHEASQDLAGDGLNRITKRLWHLDETNPSTARDGVDDAFKLQHRLCPHRNIAYDKLVSGGLYIIKAYEHGCDPWKTKGDNVSHTYNYAINMGLDPHSNWQPPAPSVWFEDVSFILATTNAPCVFTFGGVENALGVKGDPRVQRWVLQTNEVQIVTVKAWVGCHNRVAAGKSGATVRLFGAHYSLAFSTDNTPGMAPGGAPLLQKSGSRGFAPMMAAHGEDEGYTCLCLWKRENGNVAPPADVAFNFKLCWPHPPGESRGFSVAFEGVTFFEGTNYWCLATPPPVSLGYTPEDEELVATFCGEHWHAPCGCIVEPRASVQVDATTGATNFVATAASKCLCVETGDSKPVRLIPGPEIIITGTDKFSPDLFELMMLNFYIKNYLPVMSQHYYITVDVVRELKGGGHEVVQRLKFSNGQTTRAVNAENITLTWDGILEQSVDLKEGPDVFEEGGPVTPLYRQLPAALEGETVPVPFFDVVVTIWHKCEKTDNVYVKCETLPGHRVYVPQIIYIQWKDPDSRNMFTTNRYVLKDGENVLAINNAGASLVAAIDMMIAYMRAKLPDGVHVEIINGERHPDILRSKEHGNIKMVYLTNKLPDPKMEANTGVWGYAETAGINTDGNATRYGKCYVSLKIVQERFLSTFGYDVEDYSTTPYYSWMDVARALGRTSLHEPCHLLGLVSINYLHGDPRGFPLHKHNRDNNRDDPHVMDQGMFHPDTYLFDTPPITFKELNAKYLVFILPTPTQGN